MESADDGGDSSSVCCKLFWFLFPFAQTEDDNDAKRLTNNVMSPGSTQLPIWDRDNSQAMSPYMSPDMSSIASGSMIGQKYVFFFCQRLAIDNFFIDF